MGVVIHAVDTYPYNIGNPTMFLLPWINHLLSPIRFNHKDKKLKNNSIDTCFFMYAFNPSNITCI